MARQLYTKRLPELRVSDELFAKVQQVAEAQNLNVTEVMRAALEDYTSPRYEVIQVEIPITGEITKEGKIVFTSQPPFKVPPGATVRSRYMDVDLGGD